MIRRLLNSKINSIAAAAMLVAFSSLLSRLLGVMRDRILASSFGAGNELDIYYAAFRLPDAMYNLLVLGVLSAGFIPLFAKKIKDNQTNQDEAWKMANNLINILGVSLAIGSALGIIFVGKLTFIFSPGFSPDKQALVATLSRIMFLSPLLLGLSGLIGGVLQSFGRFFTYSLSPIFYNIGIIIGALYLVPIYGPLGLAFGVLLGALMHLCVQIPTLRALGYRYQFIFDWRSRDVRQIIKLMIPRTLALAVTQIDLTISTAIASTLQIGSLAIFNFANNLQYFPIGIIGISFATAAFPFLAQHANDKVKLVEHFSRVQRQILFFIVPATIMFIILRAQIIRVVLGAGAFSWQNTVLTFNTLGYFTISLFAQASIPLLARMYYAREDSRRPLYIGIATVIIDIAGALLLSKFFGVIGIALAFSLASIVNFALLWAILSRELGGLDERRILRATLQFALAGLVASLVTQIAKTTLGSILDLDRLLEVMLQGGLAGLLGLASYLFVCLKLKNTEALGLMDRLKHKLSWRAVKNSDQTEARGI
jgi:putative peptidoglycan lipid II flippase